MHEALDRAGRAPEFARALGRAHAAGVVAVLLATMLAAPPFGAGGYLALGIASVAAGWQARARPCSSRSTAGRLRTPRSPSRATSRRCAGLDKARSSPAVRRAVILVPAVTVLWGAIEEYTALLAGTLGVRAQDVPWWEAVIWAGVTEGGLAAGRARGLRARGLVGLIAAAAVVLTAGAGLGRPTGILLVAVALGTFQVAGVVAETRLQ